MKRTLLCDSRLLRPGIDAEFYALVTPTGNGHLYVEDLYEKGVRHFVVSQTVREHPDAEYRHVSDTLEALQAEAAQHRARFSIPLIAITGSTGKTLAKELLTQMLSPRWAVTRSPGSWNSQTGVALSLANLSEQTAIGVFEAGISQPGEMERLRHMLRPTIGLFTGLGKQHAENFESDEQRLAEKLSLFRDVEVLAYPACEATERCLTAMGFGGKRIAVEQAGDGALIQSLCQALCRHLGVEARVRETVLEVNLGAIARNLAHYRSHLSPRTKVACMVKAAAYGAGAPEVSRLLEDEGVDYLCVATADEGVELRQAGISAPIIIMNPEVTCLPQLFRFRLEPEVYSFRLLRALHAAAEQAGAKHFPVHVKLYKGMHRLGFDPVGDIDALIAELTADAMLRPTSVFSHLVGSDEDKFDAFSLQQHTLFLSAAQRLQSAYPNHHIIKHICNSAGITHFPEWQHDMVRLGLGLYGIDPRAEQHSLEAASRLRTTILQIRDVGAEETVGYSRRGLIKRKSRVATLPIGYADGLSRQLGNGRGHCLVGRYAAPYVGNICMDACMIDVTDIPCNEGDRVTIFGPELPVADLARLRDTIPYEVLTSVPSRVKRIYYTQ